MQKRTAFTLVELLVVIAIIALLMSILMPALARVRKQAKDVLGQANLKQWGACFAMFADDHEGSYPAGWSQDGSKCRPHPDKYWMGALRPYYGDAGDLRCCPMATKPGTEIDPKYWAGGVPPDSTFIGWGIIPGVIGETSDVWPWTVGGHYGSYGWNSFVCDTPTDKDCNPWAEPEKYNWRNAFVKGGGNIPLLGDHQWIDCWPEHSDEPPDWHGQPWDYTSQMGRICIDRHDGTVNWVFLDYSVRKIGLKGLWLLKWNRIYEAEYRPTKDEFDSAGNGWMKKYKDY
jgi:prepilin-type N-terminal cleavage/methylation domain-containing protein